MSLFSKGAVYEFEELLENSNKEDINGYHWFLAHADVDMYIKGTVERQGNEAGRINPSRMQYVDVLVEQNLIKLQANQYLLHSADSREPELAGIKGAIIGSFYAILIAFIVSFPLGVLSALYMEKIAC